MPRDYILREALSDDDRDCVGYIGYYAYDHAVNVGLKVK
jgi:hypothetical protein